MSVLYAPLPSKNVIAFLQQVTSSKLRENYQCIILYNTVGDLISAWSRSVTESHEPTPFTGLEQLEADKCFSMIGSSLTILENSQALSSLSGTLIEQDAGEDDDEVQLIRVRFGKTRELIIIPNEDFIISIITNT